MSSKLGTLTLKGVSGNEYKFNVYPLNTDFKSIGGIYYISKRIVKENGIGSHSKLYIGQTEDLSERFDNHHKWDCFEENSANAISIYREESKDERLGIEKDLIDNYEPPCNG